MEQYDIVVIGGGPGGYVAAVHASKLKKKVALVEANNLGGTCLNQGCIPSKTLLRHAEIIDQIEKAKGWGIETDTVRFSLSKMLDRKNQIVHRLRKGISSLLREGNITHLSGLATVNEDKTISITNNNQVSTIYGEKVIIATGAKPSIPPIKGLDEVDYLTSDTVFDISRLPESLTIIGGGVIGVEFACIFSSLNVPITIVEMGESLLPSEDKDASSLLHRSLTKKGIKILTRTEIIKIQQSSGEKILTIQTDEGRIDEIKTDELLLATGREPNLKGLENLPLRKAQSFIDVNEKMETSIKNIYAVGDVVGGYQLAHVASAEGIIAASSAANQGCGININAIPRCIYTNPEIAAVGLTEKEAKQKGYTVKVEVKQNISNGKALTLDEKVGFVKLIADEKYGQILGVVMVGPHVTEMISVATAFIHLEGTVEEIANMVFPHPTISENLYETANLWLQK